MKYKKIDLGDFDKLIEVEAMESYIDFRISVKKPLTQRAFNQAMKTAVDGSKKLVMSPTEIIDYTVNKGWQGVNIGYIEASKVREMNMEHETALGVNRYFASRSTREIPLNQELFDNSWADDMGDLMQ